MRLDMPGTLFTEADSHLDCYSLSNRNKTTRSEPRPGSIYRDAGVSETTVKHQILQSAKLGCELPLLLVNHELFGCYFKNVVASALVLTTPQNWIYHWLECQELHSVHSDHCLRH